MSFTCRKYTVFKIRLKQFFKRPENYLSLLIIRAAPLTLKRCLGVRKPGEMESCSQSCSSTFFSQSLIRRGNWTSSASTHRGITERENQSERSGSNKSFLHQTKCCCINHILCTVVNTHVCMAQCSPGEVCVLSQCPPGCIQQQRAHRMYHMFCCLSHKPTEIEQPSIQKSNATQRLLKIIPVQLSADHPYLHDQIHSHWADNLTAPDTHSLAYCPHQVYTSFHVCRESCHTDLEEKTSTMTFDLYLKPVVSRIIFRTGLVLLYSVITGNQ